MYNNEDAKNKPVTCGLTGFGHGLIKGLSGGWLSPSAYLSFFIDPIEDTIMQNVKADNIHATDIFSENSGSLFPEMENDTETSAVLRSLDASKFKSLVASFIWVEEYQDAIDVIEKSKLDKKEKEKRIDFLKERSKEIADNIQRCKKFVSRTEDYNGFVLEYTAIYNEENQCFKITASHPDYGSKSFESKSFSWKIVREEAKKWVDTFCTVTEEELHQEDVVPALTKDDEAKIKLSTFKVGDTVWVKNRIGEFKGANMENASVLFIDTGFVDQVHGLAIALQPERELNLNEIKVLDVIQKSPTSLTYIQVDEVVKMGWGQTQSLLNNLVERGLVRYEENEDSDRFYSIRSAATDVCEEMEEIIAQSEVRIEHGVSESETVEIQPVEIEVCENTSSPVPFSDEGTDVLLSEDDAMSIIDEINSSVDELSKTANRLRDCIKTLEIGRGYEALGFKDMSDLFKSGLLEKSRSTLQKEWQAHKVEQVLGLETGDLRLEHGLKLFPVLKKAPGKLPMVYEAATEEAQTFGTPLTAKHIQSAIAEHAPELKSKPKAKSKAAHDGGSRCFNVVLPGMKITIKEDEETITELINMEQPVEEFICEAAINYVMEMEGFNLRSQAIAFLVERNKNK